MIPRAVGFFSLLIFTSGCAAKFALAVPSPKDFKSYEIGETQEASVGDAFIRVEAGNALDVFEVIQAFQPPDLGPNPVSPWPVGKLLPHTAVSTEDPDEWLLADSETEFWVSVRPDGRIFRGWVFPYNDSNIRQGEWPPGVVLRRSNHFIRTEGSFRAELVYSGISGSTLRVAFREYSDDMARPAFSQELQYDLSESSTITFRSLQIAVLEAGNSTMTFKVLSDGGLPWLPRR